MLPKEMIMFEFTETSVCLFVFIQKHEFLDGGRKGDRNAFRQGVKPIVTLKMGI